MHSLRMLLLMLPIHYVLLSSSNILRKIMILEQLLYIYVEKNW